MSELSEYIAQRKQSLQIRRDELEAELAPIRAELAEIACAEQAMSGAPRSGRADPSDVSIKGLIMRVLGEAKCPMTANEIRHRIHIDIGREIDRTTFSPQLSRLCRAGQVTRDGMTYQAASVSAEFLTGGP